MAVATGAWIVQANWPNSLNHPEESGFAGQSAVVDPSGAVRLRLPVARAGLGVLALHATSVDWLEEAP